MKRILTAVFVLLASLTSTTVLAQGGYQVKGVVVDAVGPVIGAAVVQQGTTNGTSTGIDGDFVLNVPNGDAVIEISCIGYATQTFKASETPATITLEEDTHFLDEVVVIGYGTVKKSDLTGSVSTVKPDEVNKGVITSPADLIRGKSAGVVVTSGSGMPGSGATVRIRGGSSINASNDPLYVIDGLPVSNDGIAGMSDPLSSINPEDIESFTVLKDASATAIYGSRASNGVIVITTKKGSKTASSGPKVAADFTVSLNTVAKYNELLDADGIRSLIRDFYGENSAAEAALGSTNTDWQRQIYHNAKTIDANLSLTGKWGSALPYRISGGVISQEGTLKGSQMDRATLGLNLSPTFFDNHLTVNVNGKGTYALNWYANQDAIGAANHYDPTKPVKDPNGLNGYTTWYDTAGNLNTMATMNPVALLECWNDTADAFRFIGNTQFDYKIHGFEDLRLNLKPALTPEQLSARIRREIENAPAKKMMTVLRTLFPQRLAEEMSLMSGIGERTASSMNDKEIAGLCELIQNVPIHAKGTGGFAEAIVTRGGLNVKEFDPSTMECRSVKGLYAAGEVLDVDAHTGGFNLQIAWSTGHLAGECAAMQPEFAN